MFTSATGPHPTVPLDSHPSAPLAVPPTKGLHGRLASRKKANSSLATKELPSVRHKHWTLQRNGQVSKPSDLSVGARKDPFGDTKPPSLWNHSWPSAPKPCAKRWSITVDDFVCRLLAMASTEHQRSDRFFLDFTPCLRRFGRIPRSLVSVAQIRPPEKGVV